MKTFLNCNFNDCLASIMTIFNLHNLLNTCNLLYYCSGKNKQETIELVNTLYTNYEREITLFTEKSILKEMNVNLYTTLWDVTVQIHFTKQEAQCINIDSQFAEV